MPGGKLRALNLHPTVEEDDVRTLFSCCGRVERVFLARDNSGTCMGFAFILMRSSEEALKAVENLDGKQFFGLAIYVEEHV